MRRVKSGGGWPAIFYSLRLARKVGPWKFWKALNSKNACKTCALGMGGQLGSMRNEVGHWPEVCKKSMQAMAADMQGGIRPELFEKYSIEQLRQWTPRELEHAGRLTQPMLAAQGDDHYRPISWEEAYRRVVDKLRSIAADESFFYFSGRSSNEAAFLLQLFARLYGTNNVNNCSYYCHQASGVGLTDTLGTGTATVVLDDVEHADLFFLIGGNPASNHPRLMRTLMDIRRKGGKVIVVNPVRELGLVKFRIPSDVRSLLFGSDISSLYIQPKIGGDIAVLTGIAKAVLERGAEAKEFLTNATEGYAEYEAHCRRTSWEEIEKGSGVGRSLLERAAEMYVESKNTVFGWTMGITHHQYGVENVHAIANLAMLRGMVGRTHAGLLPIRGHSNVQGIGSMGVTPTLKAKVFDALQHEFGVSLPTTAGMDTFACVEAAAAGQVKLAWCLGGNLFGSNPDAKLAARAMESVDTVVYMNTTLNTGHAWGTGKETILLPVLARDEEPESTTQESMFNYVRLSDGGPARHVGPKSEVDVVATIARAVLGDGGAVDWESMQRTHNIRQAISRIIPGYEAIAKIDEAGKEFQINGRTFHEPKFATPSGKARFFVHDLPDIELPEGQFRLMTVRSEGQFNTVVYDEEDLYRGQERRDVILMNQNDIARMGLKKDQPVIVKNETGWLSPILVRPFDIAEQNALMYYPEANVLVPPSLDPKSKTPAFKNVLVTIEPAPIGTPTSKEPGGFVPATELAGSQS